MQKTLNSNRKSKRTTRKKKALEEPEEERGVSQQHGKGASHVTSDRSFVISMDHELIVPQREFIFRSHTNSRSHFSLSRPNEFNSEIQTLPMPKGSQSFENGVNPFAHVLSSLLGCPSDEPK